MIVSPFTPLFFTTRKTDGIESDYIQTFSTTDTILLQLFVPLDYDPVVLIIEDPIGKTHSCIEFNEWKISTTTKLCFTEIYLPSGFYRVYITGYGMSDVFRVTDDQNILSNTTLIQYSMNNNRQRTDTMFFIDGMQYFFDFRVPGGFKDSSWSFAVESEQFVTPLGDISQLFGLATTQKKFTLGGSIGVPVHFAEMLNRILTCSHVYFDGIKYSRKESNVPEMTVQIEGVNSFVFTQMLQQSINLDPIIEQKNQFIIRRTESDNYRSISETSNRKI